MEKIRLLIYTNHFYPENFKVNDIAFDFANKGYDVTVITGIPNYPEGKIYTGYGFFKKRKEYKDGVRIIRLPLIPRGKGSNIRIALNYISYFFSNIIYTLTLTLGKKFDVVFVHETSPIFICIPALIYKKIRKIPIITWVLDLWPESVFSASSIKSKSLEFVLNTLVKKIYQGSDVILTSSRGFEESILGKGNFIDKIQYFPNWAEDIFLTKFDSKKKDNVESVQLPDGFKIMYTGNLGEAQNFELIMDAAIKLREVTNIKWVFIGSGRKIEYIKEKIEEHKLENIFLLGNFPIDYMPYFFDKADVMLVSLKDELLFNITVPAKLQAYMGYGKPIIALLNGEGKNIMQESKCGYVCSQKNSSELVNVLLSLSNCDETILNQYSINAKKYYLENFSKEKNFSFLNKKILELVNAQNRTNHRHHRTRWCLFI